MVTVDDHFKTKAEAVSYARLARKEHPKNKIIKGSKLESVSVEKDPKQGYNVFLVWRFGFKTIGKSPNKAVKYKVRGLFGSGLGSR